MMDPQRMEDLSNRAFDALRRADYVRALALADQLAADLPDHPVVRALRAQALLGADAGDEAFVEARHAVELDPENEYAQRLLGLSAWRSGRLGLAQGALERAIELSAGQRPALLAEYAWFMANQRGPRLAEEAADRAVRADPESSAAWAARGLVHHRFHRRQEAEESLRRALRLDPNDLYAQATMAILLQEQSQDEKAMALASLLKDNPGAEGLVETIRTEAKRRQVDRMLVERRAFPDKTHPDSPWFRNHWLFVATLMTSGLCGLMLRPDNPVELIVCLGVPSVVLWFLLWRFFD